MDVTALVVVRNHARFISQAIESIKQSPVTSVVVVDDGSDDESATVALLTWKNPRPFLLAKTRAMGVGIARNLAIRLAPRGTYWAWLDADDFWLPGKIEKQLEALRGRTDALVLTLSEQFLDGVPCPRILKPETIGVPLPLPFPSSLLCHSDVFDRVGGFDKDLVCANDVDWFRRAFKLGIERIDVPEVLVKKRIHGENLSLHQGHDMVEQLFRVVQKPVRAGRP
jgi:glycosyltransferase involved in cell wall biosynthesis